MKKVKLEYNRQHSDDHRGKQRSRPIAALFNTMFKLENVTILVLIVLAHQIHGIYSQGKDHTFRTYNLIVDQKIAMLKIQNC